MSEAFSPSKRHLLKDLAVFASLATVGSLAQGFVALERKADRVQAPEKSFLQAAAMVGKGRMVAVGERGMVLLSDDVGKTWRQASAVPVSATLTALSFVNERRGWAVGHGGVILHTQDGGDTWAVQADGRSLARSAAAAAEQAVQSSPGDERARRELRAAQRLLSDGPDKPLLDVFFKDEQNGWVVGAYNLFFETSDGGKTWRSAMLRLDNPKAMHLYAIRVHGAQMYIAGEQGLLQRSDDNGASFRALASPYQGTWFSMAVVPQGLLLAGLRGNAFFSRDQGVTWRAITGAPPVSFVASTVLRDGRVLLANQAGQLWTTLDGAPLQPRPAPVMPMISGLLETGPDAWLITGASGVLMTSTTANSKTTP